MGLGVHGLLLCEGMRDELGVTPPDQASEAVPGRLPRAAASRSASTWTPRAPPSQG